MRATVTVDQIDACLPQTQCTQCGYPRCRAYAEALAEGRAGINQCPPGGDVTIRALSVLLGLPPQPLNPRFGAHQPRTRAVIDEDICIGCRKCLDACPVDAIVGARKLMHTVIAAECTGCELCLPPCPVDCIAMVPVLIEHARNATDSDHTSSPLPQSGRGVGEREPSPLRGRGNEGEGTSSNVIWPEYPLAETARWRERTERRLARLARNRRRARGVKAATVLPNDREKIRADIRAAVQRVKAKRKTRK